MLRYILLRVLLLTSITSSLGSSFLQNKQQRKSFIIKGEMSDNNRESPYPAMKIAKLKTVKRIIYLSHSTDGVKIYILVTSSPPCVLSRVFLRDIKFKWEGILSSWDAFPCVYVCAFETQQFLHVESGRWGCVRMRGKEYKLAYIVLCSLNNFSRPLLRLQPHSPPTRHTLITERFTCLKLRQIQQFKFSVVWKREKLV